MKKTRKTEPIDCHVNDEECLLPEWAKKLRALLREGEKDDRAGRRKE